MNVLFLYCLCLGVFSVVVIVARLSFVDIVLGGLLANLLFEIVRITLLWKRSCGLDDLQHTISHHPNQK